MIYMYLHGSIYLCITYFITCHLLSNTGRALLAITWYYLLCQQVYLLTCSITITASK